MFKKIAILVLLLLPAIAAQAFTFTISSITSMISTNGNCLAGDMLNFGMFSSYSAPNNDDGIYDWMTLVLYDGNGTAVGSGAMAVPIGMSGTMPGMAVGFPISAQTRPFTLKFFDTTRFEPVNTAANYPLLASISFDPASYGICGNLPIASNSSDTAPHFTDGRINNFDMASPFVVYGHDFEDGRGLVIYSPEGDLLLTVHPDAFAVECTGEVIELASDNGVTLYLLPSCEYQLMGRSLDGMKDYVLIFNSPYPDTGYTSYEE